MRRILTIAGSDSSGGAGIQGDLRVITLLGAFGASVITALTAQTAGEVRAVEPVPAALVARQLEAVFADGPVDAIKTGMLARADTVRAVAAAVRDARVHYLVLDPVMRSTSGTRLLAEDAMRPLCTELLPLARVVTPNLAEAAELTGSGVRDVEGMERAARRLHEMGAASVLVTGGHLDGDPLDVLFDGGECTLLAGRQTHRLGAHGSGCAHSSALATFLAMGMSVLAAASEAQRLVALAISALPPSAGMATPLAAQEWCTHSEERAGVLAALRSAMDDLSRAKLGWLVPEVRTNLGYALPQARTRAEVAAFPGRITALAGRHVAVSPPAFGASRHIASVILAAMAHDRRSRAAMNIRSSPDILGACSSAGLRIAQFDRDDEPEPVRRHEGSSLDWGTRVALRRAGKVPDAICDRGAFGKEPMIRVLGQDPAEVIGKVRTIATCTKAPREEDLT